MYISDKNLKKIAICGKQNTGKNSTADLLAKTITKLTWLDMNGKSNYEATEIMAFADPIKNMILEMFPQADKHCLFGPSELRNKIIPNATNKNGEPLTYRQAAIDIGTLGRQYNKNVWVNAFDGRIKKLAYRKLIICNDLRFINEFDYLKNNGFFIIKLVRNTVSKSTDPTETEQDGISINSFDYILDNSGNLDDLKKAVDDIVSIIS